MTRVKRQTRRWQLPAVVPIGSDKPVSETLPLAVARIVRALKPEKIILFGSYACGTPTPDSDVDLLVVMNTKEPRQIQRALPVMRALVPRDFAVDVIVRTPEEIDALLAKGSFFMRDIVTQGKMLHER